MTDVVVIGGGVIGCAIARALTLRGTSVALIDPRGVGAGASRASAGMLAPFSEGRHDRALLALGASSLSRYDDLLKSLAGEGADVPYSRAGSVDVALGAESVATIEELAASLSSDEIAHERLDRRALAALEPSVTDQAVCGLRIPSHAVVDVPALVAALWRSASDGGARLIHSRAHRISQSGTAIQVDTSEGAFRASHVVLAAGCWTGQIDVDGTAPLPVQPVRGQLLRLQIEPPVPVHTLWGPDCYVVSWPDGTLLVGATVEHVGFDERASTDGVGHLLRAVTTLLPATSRAAFSEVRVGLRPGTLDDRPIVGASRRLDGLIYATGHYRNGALLAPLTADAVVDLIDGTSLDPIWAPCDPSRFGDY